MADPNAGLGWDPKSYLAARATLTAANRYATVAPGGSYPPAFSLSDQRIRHLEQRQAGTCWVHAPVQLAETSGQAMGYQMFEICRRLVGWVGKQLEGGGNPSNGGSPTHALMAMTNEQGKGAGIAHEALLPYTDNYSALAQKPPANVFEDAKTSHLVAVVDVKSDDDSRRLISTKHGVAIGIWWTAHWDANQTFFTTIGSGSYGHAPMEIGYVTQGVWDDHDWWQLDNWHGLLYPPLPAAHASKVPGYKPITPDKTSDFWVRGDIYRQVQAKGYFERVSATDLEGIKKNIVIPGMLDTFPV